MLRTDHFIRFERVSSVSETDRGIEADVHGEQLPRRGVPPRRRAPDG